MRRAAWSLTLLAASHGANIDDVSSFTIHVIHHPNSKKSVQAKDNLRVAFCEQFGVSPCEADSSASDGTLHLVDDMVVHVPTSVMSDVSAYLQQHRVARQNPPATVDLDLAVHPNTKNGAAADYRLSVWAGAAYPFDMNAVYHYKNEAQARLGTSGATSAVTQTTTDDDMWAYTCSYDAGGAGTYVDLCSKGPYAVNSTCRAKHLGAHFHFYYRPNDADDLAAKSKFETLAGAALGLGDPSNLCHDDYGHEQPHNATCWLGGPTGGPGSSVSFPPSGGGGSFVTSHFSIYVINEDFGKVAGWILQNDVPEVLGKSLDFLLHPIYGCNFADHQMWSLHKGNTPNNLNGIEEEGGWTSSSPPQLDPMGPSAIGGTCGCSDPKATSFHLHLLYDPTNSSAAAEKESVKKLLMDNFKEADLVEDAPQSFKNITSAFLAGQVTFAISDSAAAFSIADWLALHRASIDVLLVPQTCCGPHVDYTQHALWAGNPWPLNTDALSQSLGAHMRKSPASSAPLPDHDFLLYVLYATANTWQSTAAEKFISGVSSSFGLTRKSCSSSSVEPTLSKLCMMDEVTSPTSTNPMTTAYAAVFVPKARIAEVLSWALVHRGADSAGYQVDLLMVPMTGNAASDFNAYALHAGNAWQVNQSPLKESNFLSVLV